MSTLFIMQARLQAFYELSKPRMVALFVAVGLAAYVIEEGGTFEGLLALAAVGVMASSGTNMITAYIDRETDALMERTRHRPVPSGRIAPWEALLSGAP
ncbi:MAG: hypothetical protein D6733_02305 [Methanobacteriota archaeon]|nr:MAG: hypothetical protein D6733_02305 [Euryarchaeota archaeon]